MNSLFGTMKGWATEFRGLEIQNLNAAGIQQIIFLGQFMIQPAFLKECLRVWDPENHVFAFPEGEICPLPEEFTVLGGWRTTQEPVVPDFVSNWTRKYREYLNLSRDEARTIVDGGKVDLLALVHKFRRANDPDIPIIYRRRAFGLILLHLYCFEGAIEIPSYRGQARLIRVVEQMENGVNPAWIILAETIKSLDAQKANPNAVFMGSTRLLQVWLSERLGLIDPPLKPEDYHVRSLTNRRRRYDSSKDPIIAKYAD
ncbi:uncharacterized protein LOC141614262 [Silene latifolia]|uniref:uncharacterized protein LOC141614262 n=1 Tax=Silene latifolia TaxID=37657 RepID=UPI003D7717B6